jgi:3-oxoacyl-[acyl-carrier protein] reductase
MRVQRTVVVSGAGSGIGLAVARRFAQGGDAVLVVGRRRERLEAALQTLPRDRRGAGAAAVTADLSDPAGAQRVRDAVAAWGEGRVDVVVACAGAVTRETPATLGDVADVWLADYRANVLTAVLLVEALRERLARPGARVVAVSSIAAFRGGGDSYSAAKAALIGWVRSLALELGPEGIGVNAVAPGYVAGTEFFGDRMTPARHERLVARTALRRPGTPEEVAAVVWGLADPAAAYVTGAVVRVDGGAI